MILCTKFGNKSWSLELFFLDSWVALVSVRNARPARFVLRTLPSGRHFNLVRGAAQTLFVPVAASSTSLVSLNHRSSMLRGHWCSLLLWAPGCSVSLSVFVLGISFSSGLLASTARSCRCVIEQLLAMDSRCKYPAEQQLLAFLFCADQLKFAGSV